MQPLRNIIQEWQGFEKYNCNAFSFDFFRGHFALLKHVLIETRHLYNHIFFVSFIVHVHGFLLNVNFKRNNCQIIRHFLFLIGYNFIYELLPNQHDAIYISHYGVNLFFFRHTRITFLSSSFVFTFLIFTFSAGSDYLQNLEPFNKESTHYSSRTNKRIW